MVRCITDSMDIKFEQALGVGDREAWHAAVHEVTKSRTQLSELRLFLIIFI